MIMNKIAMIACAVFLLATFSAKGTEPQPTLDGCLAVMSDTEDFMSENRGKTDELESMHSEQLNSAYNIFDKALDGENVNWHDVVRLHEQFVGDVLKASGQSTQCATTISQVLAMELMEEVIQETTESLEEIIDETAGFMAEIIEGIMDFSQILD